MFILAILGALVISGLAFYAGKLLFQLNAQNQERDAKLAKRNERATESIRVIALAMQQEQCDLSEGSIRISVLLDHIVHKQPQDYRTRYPAIHDLYDRIKHMPTHDARKELGKKEVAKLDMQRWKHEAELKEAIETELPSLTEITG